MNKLILIGNLTRDPELRTTPQGISVCDFTVAVNRKAGSQQETDYFRVTAWRQLGENCHKYLAKGRKVFVSGAVSARTYQAQDGSTRVSLEVTADDVEFLSPRNDGATPAPTHAAPPVMQSGYTVVDNDEIPF
ncbi:MAG: single-stranded DNA-binding protein [Clostridia bacterium]|nr:single-stranded DNA-binding protein [Clostridia bacterium]